MSKSGFERSVDSYKENIQKFANKHKVVFEDDGECGFGRECVGLLSGKDWVDYNPIHSESYEPIEGFFSEDLSGIVPDKAYHKHDCVAVLGRDDESIIQLSNWIDKLDELGVELAEFNTGASGLQAMITGYTRKAFRIIKKDS